MDGNSLVIQSCCFTCRDVTTKLMRCSHCHSTLYCSVQCQQKDWSSHKTHCLHHIGVNDSQSSPLTPPPTTENWKADEENPIYDLYLKIGGEPNLIKQLFCDKQAQEKWKDCISETKQALSNYSSGKVNVDSIMQQDKMPKNLPLIMEFPITWVRYCIASCVMSNSEFKAIAEFSNNSIFDVGAGSGYNDLVLAKLGCDHLYAVDCPNGDFSTLFFNVDCSGFCDEKRVTEIASNGGSAVYLWPYGYYHLDTWLRVGGKKVVTLGCFDEKNPVFKMYNPEIGEDSIPTMSPKFNRTDIFACIQRKKITSWSSSSVNYMEFWQYNEQ